MGEKEQEVLLQIGIFPGRLLEPSTSEKLLNEICKVDGVTRILLNGPGLPLRKAYENSKDTYITHQSRQVIIVENTAFELTIRVGRIYVEVDSLFVEDLRRSCKRALHMPFEFKIGHYFKDRPTTSDYAIYGTGENGKIDLDDKRKLGLANKKNEVIEPVMI